MELELVILSLITVLTDDVFFDVVVVVVDRYDAPDKLYGASIAGTKRVFIAAALDLARRYPYSSKQQTPLNHPLNNIR